MPVKAHEASEYLRTPEDVASYLNAAIEESDGDPRLLMKAFRNVAAAEVPPCRPEPTRQAEAVAASALGVGDSGASE